MLSVRVRMTETCYSPVSKLAGILPHNLPCAQLLSNVPYVTALLICTWPAAQHMIVQAPDDDL